MFGKSIVSWSTVSDIKWDWEWKTKGKYVCTVGKSQHRELWVIGKVKWVKEQREICKVSSLLAQAVQLQGVV